MMRAGTGTAWMTGKLKLRRSGLLISAAAVLLLASGCETTKGMNEKKPAEGVAAAVADDEKPVSEAPSAEEITRLKAREQRLSKQVRSLKAQLNSEKVELESLQRRLEVAQAAREDAIREVVRIRARLQGMASQAEASAMFAEARVILDRMDEEAFSGEALEQLELARSYMARGKGALDTGNPGGAAYLFDLIPGLYEAMKKTDPRVVKVKVSVAALRDSPSSSAPKVETLYLGDPVAGIEKSKDWIRVKTGTGRSGWLMTSQVQ